MKALLVRSWLRTLVRKWFGGKPRHRHDRRSATFFLEQLEERVVQSITPLASFVGSNGSTPYAALVQDSSGNLFGTAYQGGTSNDGTVFEITHGSTSITTLASFNGTNGANPFGGMVLDSSGNLFGTTENGGLDSQGTVFEIVHGSTSISSLASFYGTTNWGYPTGNLVLDSSGDLFGITESGGPNYDGTVFEIAHGSTSITLLASFNGTNGLHPFGGLVLDSSGDLFGTTSGGGTSNDGTVFEIAHGSTSITTLATFTGTNGDYPYGSMILDSSGNLFGTTIEGGASSDGAVFELAHGSTSITLLASFNGTNGSQPYAGLILDSNGDLFGTTKTGGASSDGTVFEIVDGSTSITPLASFSGTNGADPYASLVLTSSGALLGTTSAGGTSSDGTVFEILPATSTVLSSSVNPSVTGQSVTFTATVTASSGTPTGTVTFYDGTIALGTGTLNGSGSATFSISALPTGSETISAVYGGSTTYAASTSANLTQTVSLASTTTLTSSNNPSFPGESVTFTATVSASTGTPTGTVTFYDGSTTLGTGTLNSGGVATYTSTTLPGGSQIISAAYSGTTTYASSTSANLTQTVYQSSTVTLTPVNNQQSNEGQSISLTVSATDSRSSATLTYGVVSLPPGLSINSSTGLIFGLITHGDGNTGTYTPTLTVSDGTASASESFTWSVASALTLVPLSNQQSAEGSSVSLHFLAFDSNPSASLTYSEVSLPPGLNINSATGLISGTITPGDGNLGSYLPTLTVSDGISSQSASITWSIASDLTLRPIGTQLSTEGASISLVVQATDAMPSASLTYTGSGLPDQLFVNPSTGLITGTIARGAGNLGTFTPTITVSDGTSSTSETFLWNVASNITLTPVLAQINNPGDSVSLHVHASDAIASATLTYSVANLPAGLTLNASTGLIFGTVAAIAANQGSLTPTLTASDGVSTASESFTWTINSPITVVPIPTLQNNVGDPVVYHVKAYDANTSATLTYTGVNLPAGVSVNALTGIISGTLSAAAGSSLPYTHRLSRSPTAPRKPLFPSPGT